MKELSQQEQDAWWSIVNETRKAMMLEWKELYEDSCFTQVASVHVKYGRLTMEES